MAEPLAVGLQGSLALATGLLYAFVARTVGRRLFARDDARLANRAFATWWLALGAADVATGVVDLAAALGVRDAALATTFVVLVVLLVCVGVWGLTYYLAYLYTGRRAALAYLAAFFGALGLLLLYLVAWMQPTGLDVGAGGAGLAYARQPPRLASTLLGVALVGPVVAAALAYGSLWFRVEDRAHRFRIGLVAGSFLGWFGWSLVSMLLALDVRFRDDAWFAGLNRAIALAVPLLVLVAYRPPAWLRRRLEPAPLAL